MELAGAGELSSSKVIELNQGCVVQYVSLKGFLLTYNVSLSLPSLTPRPVLSNRLQYMEEFLMKTLFATVALATLLSSSADAQYGWRGYDGAYAQVRPYRAYAQVRPYRAYAQVRPYPAYYGAYAQVPPYAAYYGAYAQTPGFYDLYGRRSPYPFSVYDTR